MTAQEMEGFREKLLAMGQRLTSDVSTIAGEALRGTGNEASGNLSNSPQHMGDLASDTFEHDVSVGLLENEGKMLEQISHALERIGRGRYGECAECRAPIPLERLQAIPYAAHCVECARRVETGNFA